MVDFFIMILVYLVYKYNNQKYKIRKNKFQSLNNKKKTNENKIQMVQTA
jgi:hypothetical protein